MTFGRENRRFGGNIHGQPILQTLCCWGLLEIKTDELPTYKALNGIKKRSFGTIGLDEVNFQNIHTRPTVITSWTNGDAILDMGTMRVDGGRSAAIDSRKTIYGELIPESIKSPDLARSHNMLLSSYIPCGYGLT
jgi:hypothetical protein